MREKNSSYQFLFSGKSVKFFLHKLPECTKSNMFFTVPIFFVSEFELFLPYRKIFKYSYLDLVIL